MAVALGAVLVRRSSAELVRGTVQLRLDAVAEEVEGRASFDAFGAMTMPERLGLDLATRFPDPVALFDVRGAVLDTFGTWTAAPRLPARGAAALDAGRVVVDLAGGGFAVAPLLAPDGLPSGALLVQPLNRTVAEATAPARDALRLAALAAVLLSGLVAFALGAVVTARLVRPLRRITARVARIGEGETADRLPGADRPDELGQLSAAVNEMAAQVEASVEHLRATDRMRRDLVANVGHDLRTPLAALTLALDEAERFASEGREADAAEAVAGARAEAASAAALVADLFELSRLDAPGADGAADALRLGPVPLGEMVRDASGAHARAFARDGVALVVDIAPGLPTLDADGARLVRLVSNLLDNARRHTPAGGTVTVAATADGDGATVTVADTGPGIAPDALSLVFERYYRGTSARTRGVEGSGLGLAIARAVAEAHGGTLAAASADAGGAVFTLRMPLGGDEAPTSA